MKKILVLLFSILILPFSVYASDVYYCSDDSVIGFNPMKNHKLTEYKPEKFKMMIDFENKDMISQELFFDNLTNTKCVTYLPDNLYCINDYGMAFSFNITNSKFARSSMINVLNLTDDILLAHGTCEKF